MLSWRDDDLEVLNCLLRDGFKKWEYTKASTKEGSQDVNCVFFPSNCCFTSMSSYHTVIKLLIYVGNCCFLYRRQMAFSWHCAKWICRISKGERHQRYRQICFFMTLLSVTAATNYSYRGLMEHIHRWKKWGSIEAPWMTVKGSTHPDILLNSDIQKISMRWRRSALPATLHWSKNLARQPTTAMIWNSPILYFNLTIENEFTMHLSQTRQPKIIVVFQIILFSLNRVQMILRC